MKLSTNTDFTKLPRAGKIVRAGSPEASGTLRGSVTLPQDERHLRRRVIEIEGGDKILIDLAEAVTLRHGDRLVLDDGGQVEIRAEAEDVYDIRARDAVHLAELAWHIGNRHLPAAIEAGRILILRDHVIKAMLEGLGATVTDASEPFTPVRGAYAGPGENHHAHSHDGHGHDHAPHDHSHDHDHVHGHDHGHQNRDRFGRLPGDPHYGHNHG